MDVGYRAALGPGRIYEMGGFREVVEKFVIMVNDKNITSCTPARTGPPREDRRPDLPRHQE